MLAAQAGTYTVWVTNDFGSVLSTNAVLTVLDPWIASQPQNQTVAGGCAGQLHRRRASALRLLSYQWLKEGVPLADGTNISGAQTATLTLAHVQAEDMGIYAVAVSNLHGQVVSSNATLAANFPPVVVTQPAGQSVPAGVHGVH